LIQFLDFPFRVANSTGLHAAEYVARHERLAEVFR
jgi:hypothetical protein